MMEEETNDGRSKSGETGEGGLLSQLDPAGSTNTAVALLPAEMWSAVFSFLPTPADLFRATLVSCLWHQAATNQSLWRIHCSRWKYWNSSDNSLEQWATLHKIHKTAYMEIYKKRLEISFKQIPLLVDDMCSFDLNIQRAALRVIEQQLGMDSWEPLNDLLLYYQRGDGGGGDAQQVQQAQYNNIERIYKIKQALRTMRRYLLTQQWQHLAQRLQQQPQQPQQHGGGDGGDEVEVEEGALLIAAWEYWEQPSLISDTVRQLDQHAAIIATRLQDAVIAGEIQEKEIEIEGRGIMKKEIGGGGRWRVSDVLNAVNHHLYEVENFKGATSAYYQAQNSYLNDVLQRKTGIPISLSVLYAAICRRLGVHIDMIGMPGHFLVGVQLEKEQGSQYIYIDTFNRGDPMTKEECKLMVPSTSHLSSVDDALNTPLPYKLVYIRMLNNLRAIFRNSRIGVLGQSLILAPDPQEGLLHVTLLAHVFREYEADVALHALLKRYPSLSNSTPVIQCKQTLDEMLRPPRPPPSSPPSNALFRIGQIVECTSSLGAVGVVCSLPEGEGNSYLLLVDRTTAQGTALMQAQEYMRLRSRPTSTTTTSTTPSTTPPTSNGPIVNRHLGRYFSRFDVESDCYVPNAYMLSLYPYLSLSLPRHS